MKKLIDLNGKKFGRLLVLRKSRKNNVIVWECLCDCGNYTFVATSSLRKELTKSCGCLFSEYMDKRNSTHGLSKINKRLYRIWKGVRSRCNIPSASGYKNYGGRGIKVCQEWDDYYVFYNWATDSGYSEFLTIERIDVNGDYNQKNCKWITKKEQSQNTRNSIKTKVNGELMTLSQISKKYNINYGTLFSRFKKGNKNEELIRKVVY